VKTLQRLFLFFNFSRKRPERSSIEKDL